MSNNDNILLILVIILLIGLLLILKIVNYRIKKFDEIDMLYNELYNTTIYDLCYKIMELEKKVYGKKQNNLEQCRRNIINEINDTRNTYWIDENKELMIMYKCVLDSLKNFDDKKKKKNLTNFQNCILKKMIDSSITDN